MMETILVDGKPVEVSRFSSDETHRLWDNLEKQMGEIGTEGWPFGRQSEYLMKAVEWKLISREDALELYLVAMGLKTTL